MPAVVIGELTLSWLLAQRLEAQGSRAGRWIDEPNQLVTWCVWSFTA